MIGAIFGLVTGVLGLAVSIAEKALSLIPFLPFLK